MLINHFNIQNFKGISNCTINLEKPEPHVFSLVGLNESGKTSILEAINHFIAGDRGLQRVYGVDTVEADKSSFIPEHMRLNFNEDITISALVTLDNDDAAAIDAEFMKQGYRLDRSKKIPKITITQKFSYKNSNFLKSSRTWSIGLYAVKKSGTKSLIVDTSHPCWEPYWKITESRLPQICYFPTFLFDFPESIILEEHTDESPANAYYRRLVQDILDGLDQNISLKTHVVERVRGIDGERPWEDFQSSPQNAQVKHVFNSAASQVSKVIIESWKRVFKGNFDNKRIEIDFGIDRETELLSLKLYLSDFPERYKISDRSLGFQWFFCFWLFTYFRAYRSDKNGVIFLLDEPASNLHAKAQEEILQSLGKLATGKNVVLYSTHSHYLINPDWLDRAFVISNGRGESGLINDEFSSSLPLSISATPYRSFAFAQKNQRTYYMPILDALEYRPSSLTLSQPSLIVEGKTDYAFFKAALPDGIDYSIVPAGGAASMQPLISLLKGWGFPTACLLDDDKEGRSAITKYKSSRLLEDEDLKTLGELDASCVGKSLEQVLEREWHENIKDHFSASAVTKDMVQSFVFELTPLRCKKILTPLLKDIVGATDKWACVRLRGRKA